MACIGAEVISSFHPVGGTMLHVDRANPGLRHLAPLPCKPPVHLLVRTFKVCGSRKSTRVKREVFT